MRTFKGLVFFLVLCLSVEILGGWLTALSVRDWYPSLVKPPFTPPSWLFGPVWTLLYVLMAIAAWLVWRRPHRYELWLFGLQLFLNLSWSFLFFGLKNPFFALLDIVVLWFAIVATLIAFWKVDRRAGILFLPYLMWVTYAVYLNAGIWLLNK
ncbi:MAG: hypothetical protein BGO14_01815 [Chlamydiales bacterium 38-26]|nr:tryptophan-rich sensory protein [Chlamydiales bacterium]OJV08183.1 MAG: hypothetical protein BGO14_01815 [Chlamydiales bacterium 38-26]